MGICASSNIKLPDPTASVNEKGPRQVARSNDPPQTDRSAPNELLPDDASEQLSYLLEAEESQRKEDERLHTGVHCNVCQVCPIQGPAFVYNNMNLATLCRTCTNSPNAPSSTSPTIDHTSSCTATKCVTLVDTLACLLTSSGLVTQHNHLSEQNFIRFWKLKYPEMPDYQVNALVASINIEKGITDIHSDSFVDLWLALSSEDHNVVEQVTHRQLECHSYAECQQPFGATPILGHAYVSLDKAGVLKCYCEKCFRALTPTSTPNNPKYERCRTEQQSMSVSFRLGCLKSKKSVEDWLKQMDKNGGENEKKISIESFAALHGYTEKMSVDEMNSFCNHMNMRPGTTQLNFYQFSIGSLVLAGAHETPTLSYATLYIDSHLVEIGAGATTHVQDVDVNVKPRKKPDVQKKMTKEERKSKKKAEKRQEKKLAKIRERVNQQREEDEHLQQIRLRTKIEHQQRMDSLGGGAALAGGEVFGFEETDSEPEAL